MVHDVALTRLPFFWPQKKKKKMQERDGRYLHRQTTVNTNWKIENKIRRCTLPNYTVVTESCEQCYTARRCLVHGMPGAASPGRGDTGSVRVMLCFSGGVPWCRNPPRPGSKATGKTSWSSVSVTRFDSLVQVDVF